MITCDAPDFEEDQGPTIYAVHRHVNIVHFNSMKCPCVPLMESEIDILLKKPTPASWIN